MNSLPAKPPKAPENKASDVSMPSDSAPPERDPLSVSESHAEPKAVTRVKASTKPSSHRAATQPHPRPKRSGSDPAPRSSLPPPPSTPPPDPPTSENTSPVPALDLKVVPSTVKSPPTSPIPIPQKKQEAAHTRLTSPRSSDESSLPSSAASSASPFPSPSLSPSPSPSPSGFAAPHQLSRPGWALPSTSSTPSPAVTPASTSPVPSPVSASGSISSPIKSRAVAKSEHLPLSPQSSPSLLEHLSASSKPREAHFSSLSKSSNATSPGPARAAKSSSHGSLLPDPAAAGADLSKDKPSSPAPPEISSPSSSPVPQESLSAASASASARNEDESHSPRWPAVSAIAHLQAEESPGRYSSPMREELLNPANRYSLFSIVPQNQFESLLSHSMQRGQRPPSLSMDRRSALQRELLREQRKSGTSTNKPPVSSSLALSSSAISALASSDPDEIESELLTLNDQLSALMGEADLAVDSEEPPPKGEVETSPAVPAEEIEDKDIQQLLLDESLTFSQPDAPRDSLGGANRGVAESPKLERQTSAPSLQPKNEKPLSLSAPIPRRNSESFAELSSSPASRSSTGSSPSSSEIQFATVIRMEGDGEHVDWEALHQELDEIHEIVDEAKSELAVTAPAPPGTVDWYLEDEEAGDEEDTVTQKLWAANDEEWEGALDALEREIQQSLEEELQGDLSSSSS